MTAALAPPAADLLVAVPAAADRVRWRGVDAPALLAALLAETWRLPFDRGALARAPGRPQRGLDAAARRRNVRGVFSARHAVGGAVALVDDVYTTGATAAACARELRRAGADSVHVVTFARAVRG
jgi:predicted amidophosphoribosyltransferase